MNKIITGIVIVVALAIAAYFFMGDSAPVSTTGTSQTASVAASSNDELDSIEADLNSVNAELDLSGLE